MTEWIQNTGRRVNIYHQPRLYQDSGQDDNSESLHTNQVQNYIDVVKTKEKEISDDRKLIRNEDIFDTREEVSLDDYEIIRPEFFAHLREPAFTVNVDKVYVNTACVRLLPDVDFIQILINQQEKKLLLLPCDDTDITGYRWVKTKNGKRYATQRIGEPFVLTLCKIMDWNPDYRYKILGRLVHSKEKTLLAFDLTTYECFPKKITADGKRISSRRSLFTSEEWDGKFGPKFSESRRFLQVDTFDGYTVISIKGKQTEDTKENNTLS